MAEIVLILYVVIVQFGASAITAGVITYLRKQRESLKSFILFLVALQMVQMALLLQAVTGYAGREPTLLQGITKLLDLSGTALLIWVLPILPHYIIGTRPGRWARLFSALVVVFFLANALGALWSATNIPITLNRLLVAAVILYSAILTLVNLKFLGHPVMRKAVRLLSGISAVFIPLIYLESLRDAWPVLRRLWIIEPLSLPAYLFTLSCSGLYLVNRYFNTPPYLDPEKGKLSGHFISQFGITGREEEIIMLLRQGKTYNEIAEELLIAYKTVDSHIQSVYSKTGVRSRRQLVNLIETSYL